MSLWSDIFGTTQMNNLQKQTAAEGQSTFNTGQAGYQSGLSSAGPAINLLTQLTKGDQGDVTQAAQPEIDQISQQFDQIRNMISQQPRGGGKTTALAEAPFKKSAAIQRTEGDMRTKAATSLGSLSTNLAGLGLNEAGLGLESQGISAGIAEATPSPLQDINSLANLVGNVAGTTAGVGGLF